MLESYWVINDSLLVNGEALFLLLHTSDMTSVANVAKDFSDLVVIDDFLLENIFCICRNEATGNMNFFKKRNHCC
jgi:hypothetical protein